MDQKTHSSPAEVIEKELGVGIQFTCSVSGGRQITMTAGVPLEWDIIQLNKVLDKLALSMDRQVSKYELPRMRAELKASERQLFTIRQQKANFEQQQTADWEKTKRGAWVPTQSQRAQLDNWDKNAEHLVKDVQDRRKELEEFEQQCR